MLIDRISYISIHLVFVILAFAISASVARFIIPHILMISFRKKLFDIPDERKLHKRAIPRLGGVAFFPTILFSCCAVLAFCTLTGYSIASLLVFGFLFIGKGLWAYSMLAFSTFGVLVPFFYYNVFGSAERARKIFMGDTGSLTLGYILSFLAIKYSQNNQSLTFFTEGALLIAFSTLIIPAFDVIRVVMLRIRNGRNPFEPDRNHIHHKFLAMGFTPRKAMIIILLISCGFSALNIILMPYVDNTIMLLGDIIVWVALNLWWDHIRNIKLKKK